MAPEGEYTWTLNLVAPSKPGRYTAFYRMQTGHSVRFGHKVWADIRVIEPVKAAEPEAVLEMPKLVAQEEPVQSAFEQELE